MTEELDVEQLVRDVTATVLTKLPDKDPVEVERVVRAQVDALKDQPVRDYISVLAQRAARKQLKGS